MQSRHGQQDKAKQERLAIDRFCELYGHGAQVIKKNDPPAPDFTIRIAGKEVLVELTRYREQGPHNDAADRDLGFRRQVCDRWLYDEKVNELSLFLYYQEDNGHFKIPRLRDRPDEFEALISELKALAEQVGPWPCEEVIRVRFVPGDKVARYSRMCRRTGHRFVAVEDYRILALCFRRVMFRYHSGVKSGLPNTSLTARSTGLDLDQLEHVFVSKTAKLPPYRETAGDRAIWLLVYSEGWPSTAHVWEGDVERIVDYLGQLNNKADQRFDCVWWGDNLLTTPGQFLRRIA